MATRTSCLCWMSCLSLVLSATAHGEPPASVSPPNRSDRYGDPLPEGAIGRLGTVRLRHSGEVNSVAISPDRKLVASAATWDVSVWDLATGQKLGHFKGKVQGEEVAFSLDGRTLFSANRDGAIQHWDVASGRLIRELKGSDPRSREEFFHGLVTAFSPDRRILALTDHGHNTLLVETATGKRLLKRKKDQAMLSVAVSRDGKILATGGQDNIVRIWDIATGKQLHEFKGHDNWVYSVQFSPDDRILASAARKNLRLWEVATGRLLCEITQGGGKLSFSPDGKTLASGSGDTITLWDVGSGKEVRRFVGHRSWLIPDLAFSADGSLLVSGGRDHTVQVWEVATGKPLHHFQGHQGAAICLAFSPDGRRLASGGDEDHTLIVWDMTSHKPQHIVTDHYGWVHCLAYSQDGTTIATGDGSNGRDDREAQLRLWDVKEGRLKWQLFGHLNSVQCLAFSPDGKTLASSGWDARVRLWDPMTGKRLRQIRGADSQKLLRFAPDSRTLLIADSYGGGLALWNAEAGQKLRDLGSATEDGRRTIRAAFLASGQTILTIEQVTAMVQEHPEIPQFPPRRRTVTDLRFWDSESGRLLRSSRLEVPEHGLKFDAISPDGKILAASDDDYRSSAIHLWDTESGKPLAKLRGHTGHIASAAFSPDGKTLASGSWDTTVLLWDVSRARLIGLWYKLGGDREEAAHAAKALAANPPGAVPLLRECLQRAAALEAPYARLIADLDEHRFEAREKAFRQLEQAASAAEFALRLAMEGRLSVEAQRRAQQLLDKLTATREEQIASLIPDLEGEKSAEALQKLEAMGPSAEPALRRILQWPPFARRDGEKQLPHRARWFVQQALQRLKEPEGSSLPITPQSVPRALSVLVQIGSPEARQALQELAKGPAETRVAREAKASLGRMPEPEKQR